MTVSLSLVTSSSARIWYPESKTIIIFRVTLSIYHFPLLLRTTSREWRTRAKSGGVAGCEIKVRIISAGTARRDHPRSSSSGSPVSRLPFFIPFCFVAPFLVATVANSPLWKGEIRQGNIWGRRLEPMQVLPVISLRGSVPIPQRRNTRLIPGFEALPHCHESTPKCACRRSPGLEDSGRCVLRTEVLSGRTRVRDPIHVALFVHSRALCVVWTRDDNPLFGPLSNCYEIPRGGQNCLSLPPRSL